MESLVELTLRALCRGHDATACFVLALLTGYSGKSGMAKFDALAETTHSDVAPGPHWSGSNSGAQLPEERIFDYSFVFPERPDRQDTP